MLEFNVGELATRLRTGLGVRGRMPLGLDEHIVGTTVTADVTGAPWRRSGLQYNGAQLFATANAGERAMVTLQWNRSTGPGLLVLTRAVVDDGSFTTASGIRLNTGTIIAKYFGNPGGGIIAGTSTKPFTTERYPQQDVFTGIEQLIGQFLLTGSAALSTFSVDQWAVVGASAVPTTFDGLALLLYPGSAITFQTTVTGSATVTSQIAVSILATFWPI